MDGGGGELDTNVDLKFWSWVTINRCGSPVRLHAHLTLIHALYRFHSWFGMHDECDGDVIPTRYEGISY